MPSEVIARYRNPGPKYVYAVYFARPNGEMVHIENYSVRRYAKRSAKAWANSFQGKEYVVIREER